MTQHSLAHNPWILVGLFLLSGSHGGFAQKNRVSPCFHLEGPVAPGKEVLHDRLYDITELSLRQARHVNA